MNLALYALLFTLIVLVYQVYRYLFWGLNNTPLIHNPKSDTKISVVIPSYNETPDALRNTIDSVLNAQGNKEILIVDDGSKNKSELAEVYQYAKSKGCIVILMPKNKGKRHAQYEAFKLCSGYYIATIDSDTSIDSQSLLYAAHYLDQHKQTAAVTGLVRARNAKYNWLTRMIDARYANAFLFERKAQSTFGQVTCCCGSLSMYRADFIHSVKEQYINQTFRGYTQSFGDDRHLTNLALMRGYKVVFLQQMTATTDVPTNLKQFLKQQLRWNQSFVRENLVLFPYALKHNFALAFELIITTVIPLVALPLRLSIFAFMILIPSVVLHVVIAIIIMSMLRNVWMLQQGSLTLFLHNISYGLLHFLAVYWLLFIAIYKVFIQKNTLWGTRG